MDEVSRNPLNERLNRIRELALRRRGRDEARAVDLWDEEEPEDEVESSEDADEPESAAKPKDESGGEAEEEE